MTIMMMIIIIMVKEEKIKNRGEFCPISTIDVFSTIAS